MPADKTNLKQILREECLPALTARAAYFSVPDVRAWLRDRRLVVTPGLLREYLSEFMRGDIIHDAGRGWYSRLAQPCVLNAKPVARLVREMEKALPLLDFTCWSTEQVASYGHLLLTRFAAFVHTERDAMESAATRLDDRGYDVHLNPLGPEAARFAIGERTVVIRPRTKTQPHDGHRVSIEGLLVELFVERRALPILDAGEYFRLFDNLVDRHRISLAALLDYARERRPIGLELIRHIKAELLKNSA
jgi:hypothetical protein